MNRFSLVLLTFAAAATLRAVTLPGVDTAPPAIATGDVVPELSGAWTRGEPVKLADQRGKKLTVLYFWAVNRETLDDLPRFREIVRHFDDKPVVFVGVGCAEFRKVSKFSEVWDVPIPVVADDKLELARRFLRKSDGIPLTAVIDKEGRLVWRGRSADLPRMLTKIAGGKFDLKESIRCEKFSEQVSAALAKEHFEEALKLIDGELSRAPANTELVSAKALILARDLKRPEDAIKAVDAAIGAAPKKLALHDLKFRIINLTKMEKIRPAFYDRLCENFADRPMVLLRYGEMEMNRPPKDNRPELYCKLFSAARRAPKFKDDRERGIVLLFHAKMLQQCGHPAAALEEVRQALPLLKETPEYERARELQDFFIRLAEMQKKLGKTE